MVKKNQSGWEKDLLPKIRHFIETGNYQVTKHTLERLKQRALSLGEVLYVLNHGFHEENMTLFSNQFQT